MKKYIYTILSLCLMINPLIASEVFITSPDRFFTSKALIPETVRKDLPRTQVIDGKLGDLSSTVLTTDSRTLTQSGRPLSPTTRQQVTQQGTYGTVRLVQELWKNTLDSFPQWCPAPHMCSNCQLEQATNVNN